MSTAAVVGLGWICCGLGVLGLGRLIDGMLARGYERNHPEGDVERYMRGQARYKRWLAAVFIVAGSAVLIYALFNGRPDAG